MNLLFLGQDNTGRSALAAAMMSALLRREGRDDVRVASAGTEAREGSPAAPALRSARAEPAPAGAEAPDLTRHRARVPGPDLIRQADLILAMAPAQVEWLAARAPVPAACRLLADHAREDLGEIPGGEIPAGDPHDEATWAPCRRILASCLASLHRDLDGGSQETYAAAVERLFRDRTGGTLSLAPTDWAVIEGWWEAGVPLWMVLDSLRETMRRTGARGNARRMRRLKYCAADVRERHAAWMRARDGRAPGPAAAQPALPEGRGRAMARLIEAAGRVETSGPPAVAAALRRAAGELEACPPAAGEAGELLLIQTVDDRLAAQLRQAAGGDLLDAVSRDAAQQLAAHRERMGPEAFQTTVAVLADRLLRRHFGIPDLEA